MDEWTRQLLTGHAEFILYNLELSRPGCDPYKGAGRISWTMKDGIRFEAITSAGTGDFPPEAAASPLGLLIPPEHYFSLCAVTQGDEIVRAEGVLATEQPSMASWENVAWEWKLKSVSFIREDFPRDQEAVAALLGPHQRLEFSRASNTSDDCPYFFSNRIGSDWLEFDTEAATVGARKLQSGHLGVVMRFKDKGLNLRSELEAVEHAISFIEGRHLTLIGYECYREMETERVIVSVERASTTWMPAPLPLHGGNVEAFLAQATVFFRSKTGRAFSNYLRMCWNVNDNMGTIRAMINCSSVEAMLKLLQESAKGEEGDRTDPYRAAQECLAAYLSKRASRYGQRFVNRIANMLNGEEGIGTNAVLKKCAAGGLMGITADEAKAWTKMRHPVAHGKMIFTKTKTADLQKVFDQLHRVQNLINKLTLQAMGYSGSYYDYSRGEVRRFEPCDLAKVFD